MVSPDGKYTTFTANRNGKYQIHRVDSHSQEITNISDSEFEASDAKWSANSQEIVYLHYSGDDVPQIYSMKLDGSDKRPLVVNEYTKAEPAWSVDGKLITYTQKSQDDNQLWLFDLASGKKSLVASKVDPYTTVTWSPDSDRLVMIAADGYLSVINLDGSNQKRISQHKGFYEPFWY